MIKKHLGEEGVEALVCEHFAKGSKGATNLAKSIALNAMLSVKEMTLRRIFPLRMKFPGAYYLSPGADPPTNTRANGARQE
jgi:formyltetrahydrofolate synthetase